MVFTMHSVLIIVIKKVIQCIARNIFGKILKKWLTGESLDFLLVKRGSSLVHALFLPVEKMRTYE
jgi:hypothetical protein